MTALFHTIRLEDQYDSVVSQSDWMNQTRCSHTNTIRLEDQS